ncbi:PQQ-binding-like beta-propeller repeat protein [Streptomyces uncialis]|uniref:outer membrane protein assembly factor BamB family protein n=1 Tax=Streptomyces uncialis TaxID=1048205 RepID=UPI0037F42724
MTTSGTTADSGGASGPGPGQEEGDRPPRPAAGGGRWRWITGIAVAVVLGTVGIAAALMSTEGYLPGDAMVREWEAPADPQAEEYGNGSWLAGDTVVRSRFDALNGYDLRTGAERWEFVPPGRAEICAVDGDGGTGIAVVSYGELRGNPGGCATASGIDLKTGATLWKAPLTVRTNDMTQAPYTDQVATGGGLAVLRDWDHRWLPDADPVKDDVGERTPVRGLRAVDARTGEPRWTAGMSEDCFPYQVAAGEKRVAAILACDSELRLAVFDPADGAERWTVPLDRRGLDLSAVVSVRSVDPLVVRFARGEHGDGAFLAFSDEGRPLGRIESAGEHGEFNSEPDDAKVTIADGKLFAIVAHPDQSSPNDRVVAFDLEDGRKLWHESFKMYDVLGLHAGGGRVSVLVNPVRVGTADEDLHVFDADSGEERDHRAFRDDVDHSSGALQGVHVRGDTLVVARWGKGVRPLSAYRTW